MTKALALAIALACTVLASAQAKQINCDPPFADALQRAICADNERKWDERKLSDVFDMLARLLDEPGREALSAEQSAWEHQRREVCLAAPARDIGACHYRFTGDRLKRLQAAFAQELGRTVGTIEVLDRKLAIKRMAEQGDARPSWMRLVYHDRTLAESVRPFEVLARHGNNRGEIVIVRGWPYKDPQILAIVGRAGGEPPEVWLDFGARDSTQYSVDESGLLISEPNGLKIRWSLGEGWQTIARPSTAEPLQPPIEVPVAGTDVSPTMGHTEDKTILRTSLRAGALT